MGRLHQGMDRPGVRQVTEGNGEQGEMEETGCEIICGTPTTLVVKEQMMMMMMTFIMFIVSEKIVTLKFLPHTDTRPAGLTLIIRWTHIFHVSQ